MPTSPTPELHGIKGQPFSNFSEDGTYLERVTVKDRAEAQRILTSESGMNPDEHDPRPIYMQWTDAADLISDAGGELEEAWLECEADHPDAVPFWKDAP